MRAIIIVMLIVQAGIFLATACAILFTRSTPDRPRPIWSSFAISLIIAAGASWNIGEKHAGQPGADILMYGAPLLLGMGIMAALLLARAGAGWTGPRAPGDVLSPAGERRLLQAAVAVGCLSPFWFGLKGMIEGPGMLVGVEPAQVPADLVSHYRYLSGLFFGLGLALPSCVPRIEARTTRFRWVAGAIVVGGLARLGGLAMGDGPSTGHLIALGAELGLTPLLVLWQARAARQA